MKFQQSSSKAGKGIQDALQLVLVPGYLQNSTYSRLQRYHRREARASSLALFVSLDDRQGFERSDRTGKGLTSVLEDLDYADDIVLLTL